MASDLRVCTYNIHAGMGMDRRRDLERIGDVIRRTAADLIGLQEVDRYHQRSNRVDQIAFLADYLGMEYVFEPVLDWSPATETEEERQEYGIALLSEYPLSDVTAHMLPTGGEAEPRALLSAAIALDIVDDDQIRPLTVATTHLGLDPTSRRRQANRIVEVFGDAPRRTVLVGDFNVEPESEPARTLTGTFHDALAASGLGDEPTFPTPYVERGDRDNELQVFEPTQRIDYVFHSPDLRAVDGRIVESLASDHSMVVVDLRVPDSG